MKPLFTLHAGEWVVGNEVENRMGRNVSVWVPTKDTGVDLLVTRRDFSRGVGLQVKFSRDYSRTSSSGFGWWTFDLAKMRQSQADLWVLVIYHAREGIQYILISPRKLARLLSRIHKNRKKVQSYFMVTRDLKCWEVRGLPVAERNQLAAGGRGKTLRNFTRYLDNWVELKKLLGRRRR